MVPVPNPHGLPEPNVDAENDREEPTERLTRAPLIVPVKSVNDKVVLTPLGAGFCPGLIMLPRPSLLLLLHLVLLVVRVRLPINSLRPMGVLPTHNK